MNCELNLVSTSIIKELVLELVQNFCEIQNQCILYIEKLLVELLSWLR